MTDQPLSPIDALRVTEGNLRSLVSSHAYGEQYFRPWLRMVQRSLGSVGDGRPDEQPRTDLQRDASFSAQLARVLVVLLAVTFTLGLTACASTNTVLRIGVNVDVTDLVYGCDRDRNANCGRPGSRDIGTVELIYAPGLRLNRPLEPYSSWLHQSGVSAGRPFNDRPDQVIDSIGGGVFVQVGER